MAPVVASSKSLEKVLPSTIGIMQRVIHPAAKAHLLIHLQPQLQQNLFLTILKPGHLLSCSHK